MEPWGMREKDFRAAWTRSAQTAQGIALPKMDKTDAFNWVGYKGEKTLLVYRGVPTGDEKSFRNGDYVTTSKGYAAVYGPAVISKTVPAAHLRYVRGSKHLDSPPYSLENPPTELIYVAKRDSFHRKYRISQFPYLIKKALDTGKPVPGFNVQWLNHFLDTTSGYGDLREMISLFKGGVSVDEIADGLLEGVLTEMANPSLFRVAIPITKIRDWGVLDEKIMKELQSGVMKGLQGISDSREIRFQFFGDLRDAFLIMKAGAVKKANPHIQEIRYGDADEMMANNMELLYRVWEKKSPEGVIFNLFDYVRATMRKTGMGREADFMTYHGTWSKLGYVAGDGGVRANSTAELARWTVEVLAGNKKWEDAFTGLRHLTVKDWEALLRGAMEVVASVYGDEGEWRIKGDTFMIPKQSTLVVLYTDYPHIPKDLVKRWDAGERKFMGFMTDDLERRDQSKAVVKEIKKRLGSRYKLKFLNIAKYEAMRKAYFNRMDARSKK